METPDHIVVCGTEGLFPQITQQRAWEGLGKEGSKLRSREVCA